MRGVFVSTTLHTYMTHTKIVIVDGERRDTKTTLRIPHDIPLEDAERLVFDGYARFVVERTTETASIKKECEVR